MAQIFHRSTNFISRFSLFSAVFLAGLGLLGVLGLARSPYSTNQNVSRAQPVQFSHKHHVGDDGLDCRYCHTSVETSAVAGIPPTKTCMNCHSVLYADAPYLEPIRESFRTNQSIQWVKVHRLPDFVYFNHSIHVAKGVGCTTCHGPIAEMNITWREQSLYMRWCLECHNAPEKYLRPRSEVFNAFYKPPADQEALGNRLMKEYKVQKLTTCTTCHR
jgi:hypothetical protein